MFRKKSGLMCQICLILVVLFHICVLYKASPPSFCPKSRTQDLEAILSIISEAQHYVDIAVMEYFPTTLFERPRRWTWHSKEYVSFELSISFALFFSLCITFDWTDTGRSLMTPSGLLHLRRKWRSGCLSAAAGTLIQQCCPSFSP